MRDLIQKIALECGFKLKTQENGREDLNEYVYEFARLMAAVGAKTISEVIKFEVTNDIDKSYEKLFREKRALKQLIDEFLEED